MRQEYRVFSKRYKHPQVLILVGAPGSGKSTFAKYILRTEDNWVRINRDDFRTMQFGKTIVPREIEGLISKMVSASTKELLRNKVNVIIDATNCSSRNIQDLIQDFNELADIQFKVFDVPIETLIQRCQKRQEETGKHIPIPVIKKFAKQLQLLQQNFNFETRPKLQKFKELQYAKQDTSLPKVIICDLDGTLSLMNGRNPYDASTCQNDLLNKPVLNVLKLFAENGYNIILLSGREDTFKPQTIEFLDKHNVHYNQLIMRKSGDYRKDAEIKKEIFNQIIQPNYFVEFLLDDRDQVVEMWRKDLNLPCFQVNYGDF